MPKDWNPFTSPFIRREWHKKIRLQVPSKKVRIDGIVLIGKCALWRGWNNGKTDSEGPHGIVRIGGQRWYLHRWTYSQYHGVNLTPSDNIDHLCRHRLCFNPLHLDCVTPLENWRRGDGPACLLQNGVTEEDIEGLLP